MEVTPLSLIQMKSVLRRIINDIQLSVSWSVNHPDTLLQTCHIGNEAESLKLEKRTYRSVFQSDLRMFKFI